MKDKLQKQHDLLESIGKNLKDFQKQELSNLNINEDCYILGAGKGSVKLADLVLKQGIHCKDGILIGLESGVYKGIQVFEGSHPYPDENSVSASYELLDLARQIPKDSTVIFCLSGGASALLCIPPYGVEIAEIRTLYKLLLNSGASIQQMNIVRKHVCDLKGGKLGEELSHVRLVTLIESDVPGDDVSTIGSGPTVPDPSTYTDAISVLKEFKIWDVVPGSIKRHLIFGEEGVIPENPKPDEAHHSNHIVQIVSKSIGLAETISKKLKSHDYEVWVSNEAYSGDIKSVSKQICSKAIKVLSGNDSLKKPAALVFHGESTVNVKGSGKGGRNQELALIAALSIEGQHSISMLSIGTDGIDGPTDSAGAIINSLTTLHARKKGISPENILQQNNSYAFHEEMNTHLKIGATGINLMDLQVVLID
tara:strand:- start:28053 stop:29321 length:1269 start_codon:yes stop_codon:yes gene_type:complete